MVRGGRDELHRWAAEISLRWLPFEVGLRNLQEGGLDSNDPFCDWLRGAEHPDDVLGGDDEPWEE